MEAIFRESLLPSALGAATYARMPAAQVVEIYHVLFKVSRTEVNPQSEPRYSTSRHAQLMSEEPCCVVELTHGRGIAQACAGFSTQILVQICVLAIVAFGAPTMPKDFENCRCRQTNVAQSEMVLPENREIFTSIFSKDGTDMPNSWRPKKARIDVSCALNHCSGRDASFIVLLSRSVCVRLHLCHVTGRKIVVRRSVLVAKTQLSSAVSAWHDEQTRASESGQHQECQRRL